jgi:hypothetical protein
MKFYISGFLENLSKKLKFHQNLTRTTGTSHEDLCTFLIISRSILVRIRNASDKSYRENQNTHSMFNTVFSENRVVYETMWKNMVQPDRPQTAIRRMRFAR